MVGVGPTTRDVYIPQEYIYTQVTHTNFYTYNINTIKPLPFEYSLTVQFGSRESNPNRFITEPYKIFETWTELNWTTKPFKPNRYENTNR